MVAGPQGIGYDTGGNKENTDRIKEVPKCIS